MLTEALRGEAIGLVNSTTGAVASRRPQRSRLVASVAAVAAAGAALLLTGGLGSAARAQSLDTGDARDFSVKVGVYSPSSKEVRTASATFIPMVEGDYTIQKYPESHFNSVLSVGYIEHTNFRMIPITVSQIYRDPNNAAGVNYFYGLGVGYYSTRLQEPGTSDRVKGLFGGFAVAGLDLTKTIFVEAKYHYLSRYDDKFVGGFQTTAGIRF